MNEKVNLISKYSDVNKHEHYSKSVQFPFYLSNELLVEVF